MALSDDGTTMIVASGTKIHIYQRENSSWRRQQSYPVSGKIKVALAGDGKTAAVGIRNHNRSRGMARVFYMKGGGWSEGPHLDKSLLGPADRYGRRVPLFGSSVALNGDGTIMVVGAAGDSTRSTEVTPAGSPVPTSVPVAIAARPTPVRPIYASALVTASSRLRGAPTLRPRMRMRMICLDGP